MAIINHTKKEINAKLVYFGPPAAGKAASLSVICRKLKAEYRSKLKSMAVQNDRMLFFDFAPPGQNAPPGYRVRFHVYTLTGPVTSLSVWKMVLKGVDGVVFVADSSPGSMADNEASLAQLESCLSDHGTSLVKVPCVIQYNKRDLSSPLPLDELEHFLNTAGVPSVASIAGKGEGVAEGLSRLVRLVTARISAECLEPGEGGGTLSGDIGLVEECRVEEMAATPSSVTAPAEPAAVTAAPPELSLTLSGAPQILAGGQLRVPLLLRCGAQEKTMFLSLSLAAENE